MTYQMTCSCGHTMKVDASSREKAVSKMKKMMDKKAITAHMKKMHKGEPLMTVAEVHKGIEMMLKQA